MARLTKAQKASQLRRDARNRALRSFLQGLAIDLVIALTLVISAFLNDSHGMNYRLLAATLAKTAVQASASYLMRRFADPSRLPTPLPPDPPGEPNEDVEP